jgi:hypothetical protein
VEANLSKVKMDQTTQREQAERQRLERELVSGNDNKLNDSLAAVLGSMLSAIESESATQYQQASQLAPVQRAAEALNNEDFSGFYFALQYPFNKVVDGLLEDRFPGNGAHNIRFLFKNSEFVKRHVRRLIEKYEGSMCCADKTRSVLCAFLGFLKTGKPIVWDYRQEYTFHLPNRVFTDHASTIEYLGSLAPLMSGDPGPYLNALLSIQKHAEQAAHCLDGKQ